MLHQKKFIQLKRTFLFFFIIKEISFTLIRTVRIVRPLIGRSERQSNFVFLWESSVSGRRRRQSKSFIVIHVEIEFDFCRHVRRVLVDLCAEKIDTETNLRWNQSDDITRSIIIELFIQYPRFKSKYMINNEREDSLTDCLFRSAHSIRWLHFPMISLDWTAIVKGLNVLEHRLSSFAAFFSPVWRKN